MPVRVSTPVELSFNELVSQETKRVGAPPKKRASGLSSQPGRFLCSSPSVSCCSEAFPASGHRECPVSSALGGQTGHTGKQRQPEEKHLQEHESDSSRCMETLSCLLHHLCRSSSAEKTKQNKEWRKYRSCWKMKPVLCSDLTYFSKSSIG